MWQELKGTLQQSITSQTTSFCFSFFHSFFHFLHAHKTREDLPESLVDFKDGSLRTKVSGKLGSQLMCRTWWVFCFGVSPPSLRARRAQTFKAPSRNLLQSHVLRAAYQWRFSPQRCLLRRWISATAPGALEDLGGYLLLGVSARGSHCRIPRSFRP